MTTRTPATTLITTLLSPYTLQVAVTNMAENGMAACKHDEPKKIPLLMAGDDLFSANKKIDITEHVEAVLPGLKDMQI